MLPGQNPQPHTATPPAPMGRAYLESRIATHDGYIWPVERRLMLAAGPIRERMAQDIRQAIAEIGADECVSEDTLRWIGWLPAQIEAHAGPAFEQVKQARKAERRATRLPLGRAA